MSKKWCADSWCMWAPQREPREVMKVDKTDLMVVVGLLVVICIGGLWYANLGHSVDELGKLKELGIEMEVGLTLGQVWALWGTPDHAQYFPLLKRAVYTWDTPYRRVTLTTETEPWRVVNFAGYTGLLAP